MLREETVKVLIKKKKNLYLCGDGCQPVLFGHCFTICAYTKLCCVPETNVICQLCLGYNKSHCHCLLDMDVTKPTRVFPSLWVALWESAGAVKRPPFIGSSAGRSGGHPGVCTGELRHCPLVSTSLIPREQLPGLTQYLTDPDQRNPPKFLLLKI